MSGALFDGVDAKRLVERLIPSDALPFDVHELLNVLIKDGVYNAIGECKWVEWPEVHIYNRRIGLKDKSDATSMDIRLAAYFQELINRAREMTPAKKNSLIPQRGWYIGYIDIAEDLAYGPSYKRKSKPSCILWELTDNARKFNCCHPLLLLEQRSEERQMEDALQRTFIKLSLLMQAEARRFAIGIAIVCREMRLMFANRSAVLVTAPIDFHNEPEIFLKVVVGSAFVELQYLGLDTSMAHLLKLVTNATFATVKLGRINFQNKSYEVVQQIRKRNFSLHNDATYCYLVKDKDAGRNLIIKESWVPTSEDCMEQEVLKELAGVQNVAQLIDEQVVNLCDRHHLTTSIVNDLCPARPNKRKVGSSGEKIITVVERINRRYLFGPYCESMLSFRTRKELVNGFIDWVEGTQTNLSTHRV